MTHANIPQGQWARPRFAAEAYVGSAYVVEDADGEYSANPADYWAAPDTAPIGAIVRRAHPYRTLTGRIVFSSRLIRSEGTIGHLRRLARAAEGLVR